MTEALSIEDPASIQFNRDEYDAWKRDQENEEEFIGGLDVEALAKSAQEFWNSQQFFCSPQWGALEVWEKNKWRNLILHIQKVMLHFNQGKQNA